MILVMGATGQIGGLVVADLRARGAVVRALVRDPARAEGLRTQGVRIAVGDLSQPASLAGVEGVLLLSPSAPDQVALQSAMVQAAEEAGVRLLVKISGAHASPQAPGQFPRWHGEVEGRIRQSGLAYTFVQPVYFLQNYPTQIAAALAEPGHEGHTYIVTGPALITQAQVAAAISAEMGRAVPYRQVPPAVLRAGMVGAGQPEWLADGVLELYAFMDTDVTDDVARVIGRQPITLAGFVHGHAAAFGQAVAS